MSLDHFRPTGRPVPNSLCPDFQGLVACAPYVAPAPFRRAARG